jgi:uncharacterized membrane protein
MIRNRKIQVLITFVLTAITIAISYFIYTPEMYNKEKIKKMSQEEKIINYDSLMSKIIQDSSSKLRKILDSIYGIEKINSTMYK